MLVYQQIYFKSNKFKNLAKSSAGKLMIWTFFQIVSTSKDKEYFIFDLIFNLNFILTIFAFLV